MKIMLRLDQRWDSLRALALGRRDGVQEGVLQGDLSSSIRCGSVLP